MQSVEQTYQHELARAIRNYAQSPALSQLRGGGAEVTAITFGLPVATVRAATTVAQCFMPAQSARKL